MEFIHRSFSKVAILIVILVICHFNLWAQKKSLRFQHYTMEEGLPQNLVDCILQDSRGYMWFGTWGGLCRFDGYTFKSYRQQTKEYSTVSNNFIYALEEDNNGNIWVGTNSGLNIYKSNLDSFQVIISTNPDFKIFNEKVTAITKDEHDKKNILWIGSSSGLSQVKIDSESNITEVHTYSFGNKQNNISGTAINHLLIDSHDNLWVSTDNGICILKKDAVEFVYLKNNPAEFNSLTFNVVKCVYEDSKGIIWIATEFGLSKYFPSENRFVNYIHWNDVSSSLVHSYIMSVIEDTYGNLIIGTFGGISILKNGTDGIFLNYTESPSSEYGLNNNFVNCLYRDKNKNIWIGTERGGINRYNCAKTEFEYFESETGISNSLSNNLINSILEDDENIWIGTAGGGLNRYNKKSGNFKVYKYNPANLKNNLDDFISVIHRDAHNNLWIGSWGSGIFKLSNENTPNELFINYRSLPDDKGLINNFISSIISDSVGNLWIGTYEGVDKYDYKTNEFKRFLNGKMDPRLVKIGYLLLDKNQNLWIGTRQGLFKIIFKKGSSEFEIKSFLKDEKRAGSLSDNYVTSIFQDSKNNIWVGTYGFGVNKLTDEKNGGTFECFSIDNGLPNNTIYRILEDNIGNIWFSTDYGLSVYNTKEKRFNNYFIADGLQNNQYYWNAAFKNSDGKLYFGGMNGVNTFSPESLNIKAEHQQGVVLTDFKIYGRSVKPCKKFDGRVILKQSLTSAKQMVISYKSKEISFEFSALNFEQPNSIKYAYKLAGFDENWTIVGPERRFAGYTNLKYGKYVFRVKATNINGEWGLPTDIELVIIPPFWATWWFKMILILVLLAGIISYNRIKVYSLEEQKQKLEIQVTERTSEIEKQKEKLKSQNEQIHKQRDKLFELNKKVKTANEYKLKFFTNISHEFRTPITLILGPVESLLEDPETPDKTKKSLSLINRNAKRLLHLINQLMDFRKIEQGKTALTVSLTNCSEFLSNIVQAFSPLAEQKNISLELKSDTVEGETWFDFQKIEIVLYNLLSNAFKYTPSGGKISISAEIKVTKPQFITIVVSDTGCGIPNDKLNKIFIRFYQVESDSLKGGNFGTGIGLSLAKELVEAHKGTIHVDSQIGEGSTFIVEVPVRRECFNDSEITEKQYEPATITKKIIGLTEELLKTNDEATPRKQVEIISERNTVLIVEDNADLRTFIASKLNENYNILEASDGLQGFELASEHNPDVIVSDIMMPVMDGLELCKKAKSNLLTSHIPIILLTAKSEVEDEIEGIETGADNYLAKPFNFGLLQAYISNLIESRKNLYKTFLLQNNTDTKILAKTSTDEIFLDKIVKTIEENLENTEFNVSALADKMMMSRGHLHRKLFALSNLSPIDFINNIRLKKSLELLHNLNLNISDVAYAVGYSDPKYFTRLFRKQYGKTPSKYQEEIQQKK